MIRTFKKLRYARGGYSVQLMIDGKLIGARRFHADAAGLSDAEVDVLHATVRRERDRWLRLWVAGKLKL